MERALFLAAGFWVSGVGALSVGAGYMIAQASSIRHRNSLPAPSIHIMCQETPPPSPSMTPKSSPPSSPLGTPLPSELEEDASNELTLIRPDDATGLLSDSQRQRLRPINPLKRKRRSRKIRSHKISDDKFIPLVPGARTSTEESILNAYTGDTLDDKRRAGEDYWVDPALVQSEMKTKELEESRRKQFKMREKSFETDRLRSELSDPYKNNYIGSMVIGIGVIATALSFFPGLLEIPTIEGIATFPDSL